MTHFFLFSRHDVNDTTHATSSRQTTTGYFEKQRQEHKLGLLLLAVSLLFVVCQSLKMVPDLYEVVFWSVLIFILNYRYTVETWVGVLNVYHFDIA